MARDNDLAPAERFVLAQALYSKLAGAVDTKRADSARAAINAVYREMWEQTGSKSFTLRFKGEKVGTYCIAETKGEPPTEGREFAVSDYLALLKWVARLAREDADTLVGVLDSAGVADKIAERYLRETGEMPDGCEMRTVRTRGKVGGQYKGNSIRGLDADRVLQLAPEGAVADLVGSIGELPTALAGLLGGGTDE